MRKKIKVLDINKNGKKDGFEIARAKGMAKGMGARVELKKGGGAGKGTHVTKDGRTVKKGLWYNIAMKKKRGEKMRKAGAKGAPTKKAFKKSQA